MQVVGAYICRPSAIDETRRPSPFSNLHLFLALRSFVYPSPNYTQKGTGRRRPYDDESSSRCPGRSPSPDQPAIHPSILFARFTLLGADAKRTADLLAEPVSVSLMRSMHARTHARTHRGWCVAIYRFPCAAPRSLTTDQHCANTPPPPPSVASFFSSSRRCPACQQGTSRPREGSTLSYLFMRARPRLYRLSPISRRFYFCLFTGLGLAGTRLTRWPALQLSLGGE